MSYAQLADSVDALGASNLLLTQQAQLAITQAQQAAQTATEKASEATTQAGLLTGPNGASNVGATDALGKPSKVQEALNLLGLTKAKSLRMYGAVLNGVADDYPALQAALAAGDMPVLDGKCRIVFPTGAAAAQAIATMNTWQVLDKCTLVLPSANDITFSTLLDLNNDTLAKVTMNGQFINSGAVTSIAHVGGSAGGWRFDIGLTTIGAAKVGDYLMMRPSRTNYTKWEAFVAGCWKITAIVGNVVSVQSANAFPTLPVEPVGVSGSMVSYIVRTVFNFPANSIGLRLNGCRIGGITNLVLSGTFNALTEAPFDGAGDGLQVGGAPDTLNTGLNESEQIHSGAIWVQRVAVVNFHGNGAQVLKGSLYGSLFYVCGNAWRGEQAAGLGEALVKGSVSVGNGASGTETEASGNLNCADSWIIGNREQGVYAIGLSQVESNGSVVMFNLGAQLDARNGGHILGDHNIVEGTTAVLCNGGRVLIGANATVSGAITVNEVGAVIAVGATSVTGSVSVTDDSVYILPNGNRYQQNNVNSKQLTLQPPATATPANNGEMVFQLTGDTTLQIKVKGADGIVRTGTINLT